jgi:hypothetical protein
LLIAFGDIVTHDKWKARYHLRLALGYPHSGIDPDSRSDMRGYRHMTVRPDLSVVMVNEGLSGSGSGARSLLRESADFPAQVESGAAAGLRLQNEY